jgi:hypothetical protein
MRRDRASAACAGTSIKTDADPSEPAAAGDVIGTVVFVPQVLQRMRFPA